MRSEDQPSRVLYELCSLLLSVLRSPHLAGPEMPPPPPLPAQASRAVAEPPPARRPRLRLSPTGLASLLLGVALAMMFCGSVTFAIGFILMPWVLGMVMVLGFIGIVSNLSGLGRAIFYLGFPSASRVSSNDVPAFYIMRKPSIMSVRLSARELGPTIVPSDVVLTKRFLILLHESFTQYLVLFSWAVHYGSY